MRKDTYKPKQENVIKLKKYLEGMEAHSKRLNRELQKKD